MAINLNYLKTRVVRYPALAVTGIVTIIATGLRFDLSRSDWSGWVQAIGSISALGIAIYVMSRQNKHSLAVMLGAEKRALLRRAYAVTTIVRRGHEQIHACLIGIETTARANDVAKVRAQWKLGIEVSKRVREVISPIPMHEMGSLELAAGLHETFVALALFDHAANNFLTNPATSPSLSHLPDTCERVRKRINKASEDMRKGLDDLENLI